MLKNSGKTVGKTEVVKYLRKILWGQFMKCRAFLHELSA
jgi:hypothetical protein